MYSRTNYAYVKKRKDFGRQPLFTLVKGHLIDSINPDKAEQKKYILRNPVQRHVQATLPQTLHDVNTKKVCYEETGMNHTEGGWPGEVNQDNEEHLHRHRRHCTHDEDYVNAIMNVAPRMHHRIDQNNAVNLYESYFTNMPEQSEVETYNIREENVFRDSQKRPVSCICWTNEPESKLVVAYAYNEWITNSRPRLSNVCYIWNITNQTTPEHEIRPKFPCGQLACSPIYPEVLVAGLTNGTVNVFDVRAGEKAVSASSVFNSHFAPVSAIRYTHSKTNTQFFTGSQDGCCYWWDLRDLSNPTDQMIMNLTLKPGEAPALATAESVSSLDFNAGVPTKFLCGTNTGLVISVNRMGREHSEVMSALWQAHSGAVRTVQRSPCTMRMFGTCGDYTAKIWSEEVRSSPIIETKPYNFQVSDFAWAPFRYSCCMTVCQGGYLYYWDFLRKYKEPVAFLKVSKSSLTKVTPHESGHYIAVGNDCGSTYLTTIPENMVVPGDNDKQLMSAVYERETKREHHLEARTREINLKLRLHEEQEQNPVEIEEIDDEDVLVAAEEEYFRTVDAELGKMGDGNLGFQ